MSIFSDIAEFVAGVSAITVSLSDSAEALTTSIKMIVTLFDAGEAVASAVGAEAKALYNSLTSAVLAFEGKATKATSAALKTEVAAAIAFMKARKVTTSSKAVPGADGVKYVLKYEII